MTGTEQNAQGQHAELDRGVTELERLLRHGELDGLLARWTDLERKIRRHLAHEETLVLPEYANHDAENAAAIEAAHDDLRVRLRACRQALSNGDAETTALRRVLSAYRAHQLFEDTTMYKWRSDNRDA